MASPATEILGPWPAANPAIRSLSHRQQAGNVSRLKDVGVGVVAQDFVIFDDVPNVIKRMFSSFLKHFEATNIQKKWNVKKKVGKMGEDFWLQIFLFTTL